MMRLVGHVRRIWEADCIYGFGRKNQKERDQ
jgi:hypothetical protein